MRMNRHHLLEIILWPNGDGTFSKIINTATRLRELGIYDDWKLTITIPVDEHIRMHNHNRLEDYYSKISAAKKGKKLSAEHRAKMSAAKKGKKFTAEHRAKLSAAKISNSNAKGYKHSEEAKAKMSAAKKGNTNSKGNTNVRGRHWYNNGVVNKLTKECPPGFTIGRIIKKEQLFNCSFLLRIFV